MKKEKAHLRRCGFDQLFCTQISPYPLTVFRGPLLHSEGGQYSAPVVEQHESLVRWEAAERLRRSRECLRDLPVAICEKEGRGGMFGREK